MSPFESLELTTETLRELTRDELGQVAGGATVTSPCATTFPPITVLVVTAVQAEVRRWAADQTDTTVCI